MNYKEEVLKLHPDAKCKSQNCPYSIRYSIILSGGEDLDNLMTLPSEDEAWEYAYMQIEFKKIMPITQ